jgi:alcohol dehydrogenase class IV
VRADVESARRDWEEAYRRLAEEVRDPAKADALHSQLEVVSEELRKRVGGAYTLVELAHEYSRADDWAREAVAQKAAAAGWPRTLSMVEGAAFLLYSRGAVDYEP